MVSLYIWIASGVGQFNFNVRIKIIKLCNAVCLFWVEADSLSKSEESQYTINFQCKYICIASVWTLEGLVLPHPSCMNPLLFSLEGGGKGWIKPWWNQLLRDLFPVASGQTLNPLCGGNGAGFPAIGFDLQLAGVWPWQLGELLSWEECCDCWYQLVDDYVENLSFGILDGADEVHSSWEQIFLNQTSNEN